MNTLCPWSPLWSEYDRIRSWTLGSNLLEREWPGLPSVSAWALSRNRCLIYVQWAAYTYIPKPGPSMLRHVNTLRRAALSPVIGTLVPHSFTSILRPKGYKKRQKGWRRKGKKCRVAIVPTFLGGLTRGSLHLYIYILYIYICVGERGEGTSVGDTPAPLWHNVQTRGKQANCPQNSAKTERKKRVRENDR